MYKKYINSILNSRKFEQDAGANSGGDPGTSKKKDDDSQVDTPPADNGEDDPNGKPAKKKDERLFTRAEMAKIVQEESQKAVQAAMNEAEKLKNMNNVQKLEYQNKQLQEENSKFKQRETLFEMTKEANKMLTENNLIASDAVLDMLVTEDAETTKERVNSYINDVQEEAKRITVKRNTGTTPTKLTSQQQASSEISDLATKLNESRITN